MRTPNLEAKFRDLLIGGQSRDDLLQHRMLEPGIRECVALVVMPSFVPYLSVDFQSSWFKMAHSWTGKVGAELLFDVISTAYERHSMIVTTNLPFENWTEVLGSERLTGATLDRLTHRCHILQAGGESYRLRDAQGRRKRSRGSGHKSK